MSSSTEDDIKLYYIQQMGCMPSKSEKKQMKKFVPDEAANYEKSKNSSDITSNSMVINAVDSEINVMEDDIQFQSYEQKIVKLNPEKPLETERRKQIHIKQQDKFTYNQKDVAKSIILEEEGYYQKQSEKSNIQDEKEDIDEKANSKFQYNPRSLRDTQNISQPLFNWEDQNQSMSRTPKKYINGLTVIMEVSGDYTIPCESKIRATDRVHSSVHNSHLNMSKYDVSNANSLRFSPNIEKFELPSVNIYNSEYTIRSQEDVSYSLTKPPNVNALAVDIHNSET